MEYQVGKVDAGQYSDLEIPSQTEYLVDKKHKTLIIRDGRDTSFAY
jgi:hypothetical protein